MGEKIVRRRLADGTIREYRYRRKGGNIAPGTLGALIQEYRRSPEFLMLNDKTKTGYLRAIRELYRLYPVRIEDIQRRHITKHRDAKRSTPAAANKIVATMSVLMQYAIDMEYRETNPAHRIAFLPVGEYRRWPDDAVTYALERFPERLRRAIVLAVHTGQRQGDVLAMRWSDYDGEGIQVVQQKTGAKLWIPCSAALKTELDEWKRDRSSVTIIVNTHGRPYKGWSFASLFSVEVKKHQELHGLVFHGLRKTAAARLAEAGCSTHEIAAITGHKTLGMLMHYTREAEQKTRARAAIIKLENVRGEMTGKNRTSN